MPCVSVYTLTQGTAHSTVPISRSTKDAGRRVIDGNVVALCDPTHYPEPPLATDMIDELRQVKVLYEVI